MNILLFVDFKLAVFHDELQVFLFHIAVYKFVEACHTGIAGTGNGIFNGFPVDGIAGFHCLKHNVCGVVSQGRPVGWIASVFFPVGFNEFLNRLILIFRSEGSEGIYPFYSLAAFRNQRRRIQTVRAADRKVSDTQRIRLGGYQTGLSDKAADEYAVYAL